MLRLYRYYYKDASHGGKAWWQLQKNYTKHIEQVLAATPNKTTKIDEPDMRDTAEEVRTNS